MTREEAIETLKNHKPNDISNAIKVGEAIYMAIEALSAETCEDCISRAEALKNLALTNSKDDVYRMINSLSSVQPIRPKGKWIKGDKSLQCLKCGAKGENIETDFVFNYCPCCGADMRESEVSDEDSN